MSSSLTLARATLFRPKVEIVPGSDILMSESMLNVQTIIVMMHWKSDALFKQQTCSDLGNQQSHKLFVDWQNLIVKFVK